MICPCCNKELPDYRIYSDRHGKCINVVMR